MEFQTLVTRIEEGVCLVTINRPEKLNALNAQVKAELRALFLALQNDPGVAGVVLTGAGEKSFVAGTDIGELTTLDEESGREFSRGGQAVFDLIEGLGKPVIAAVNGYALGGGCELALACHIRIAAEGARFGQPEVNLGVIPGYGGTQRLARCVGTGRALEMILTGNPIDAHEALRIGLVNRVVPAAELIPACIGMARLIGTRGPVSTRLALEAVVNGAGKSLADGQRLEAELFGKCCGTRDFKEGTSAFLEKRKPDFTGR